MNYTKQNRALVIFKMLGNANRIKILKIIISAGERGIAVNQIVSQLNISQPAISTHLKLMRIHKIIRANQRKLNMFYTIRDPLAFHLIKIAEA